MSIEVILPLRPPPKGEKYGSVTIEVIDWNISNYVHSHRMIPIGRNLWRAVVLVPVTSLLEKIDYSFKVDILSSAYFGLKQNYTTIESMGYKMEEDNTIRQFFYQRVLPLEVLSHLKDIIMRVSEEKTLADCTIQIEKFCKGCRFSLEFLKTVFTSLLCEIDKMSKKQMLLCAVVFGNLFQSYYTIADSILSSATARDLCNSLTHFNSTELSYSCTKYLFNVVDDLCRVALGRHYCFLSCISIIYPFFDEAYISTKVNELVRKKEPLLTESVEEITEKHLLTLFEKVCQRTEMEHARRLLEQLLLHIPLNQAMKVYIDLKKKDSDLFISADGKRVLCDSLLESVRIFLRSPKRNIKELKSFVQSLHDIPELAVAKAELEAGIARCIGTVMQNEKDALKELILREDLFVSEKSQLHLIQSFTTLKQPNLHFVLFDILMEAKFRETFSKADKVWFHDCFDNAVVHIKREQNEEKKLENVYKYLAKAHEVCAHLGSEELSSYLDKIGFEYLKLIDLRKLMRMTKVIEDLSDKDASIGELFKGHVQAILKDQYESNYNEMLISLCGTYGKLRINSRYDYLFKIS